MANQKQVYKCLICGNVVELLHAGAGQLVCCGQPMQLLNELENDEGKEKHAPVIEKTENGIRVKVGSIPHPMEKDHYIEWIEVISNGTVYRKFLNPGDQPEATFDIKDKDIIARSYCNIHGLWKG